MNKSFTIITVFIIGVLVGLCFRYLYLANYDFNNFVNGQPSPILQAEAQEFVNSLKGFMFWWLLTLVVCIPLIFSTIYYLWYTNRPGRKYAWCTWMKWFGCSILSQVIVAPIICGWFWEDYEGLLGIFAQFSGVGFVLGVILYLLSSLFYSFGKNTHCTAPLTWIKRY